MPIIKSAKKRVRIAEKASVRNRKTKRTLKTAIKAFQKSLSGTSKTSATKTHAAAQSAIGKAAKKHVIHKNKAARQQRQLAAKAKAVGTKKTTAAASTKKSTPKRTTRPVTKKPTTKK